MNHKTIAVVWWWAAGMMVVATLLEKWYSWENILLFEKNSRLWAKVIISGGWRCNVTTGNFKTKELLHYYPRGAIFLQYALKVCSPRAIRRWFEQQGVPLKEEQDKRIFPVSDDGKDIVGVFERIFAQEHVQVKLKESVVDIEKVSEETQDVSFVLTTDATKYHVDAVVLTTWWHAYAHTWSTGDGYAFARALWHTITPLWPSLNSFKIADSRLSSCSGISFSDAILTTNDHAGEKKEVVWPVLITHFGLSGPAVFALSSHVPFVSLSPQAPLKVVMRIDATKSYEWWWNMLRDASSQSPKKEIGTILREYMPRKFVEVLLAELSIQVHSALSMFRKEDRKLLARTLWEGIVLHFVQRRPWDEFVTAWGVSLDEVDPKTWWSRVCSWLYFAWEILDIDGYTWGYNLTASWSMGRVVGEALAEM